MNAHYPSRAQRYALDLVTLDGWGRRAAGVYPLRLEAYRVYGAPVLSPCDCRVVGAEDGHPDLPPGRMDRERIAGNHLVLALSRGGRDYLVVLAHPRRGSVKVRGRTGCGSARRWPGWATRATPASPTSTRSSAVIRARPFAAQACRTPSPVVS